MNFSQYTTKTIDEVFNDLKTSENGLSENEAENRLKTYGPNEIKAKETGLFHIFLRQLKSPFFYLLLIAGLIAFFIGEKTNCLIILLFIIVNISLGFFQEAKAQKAVALLKKYIPSKTRILRDGQEKLIDKSHLVPGDIIFLEIGNIAPADLRITDTENLLVDESVLTGESAAVSKNKNPLKEETKEIFKAENIIFTGTSVVSGKVKGIVISTARNTVLGEITKLVSTIKKESVYEKDLMRFSKMVLKIIVSTIIIVFALNLLVRGTTNLFNFLIFSITLIVSIIPEALPVVVTICLSKGALNLAKKQVIIKRLSAIEDLGDIEILCTDKTGTLTEGKMELEEIFSPDKEKCLLYSLLSSSYAKEQIETSLSPFDFAALKKSPADIQRHLQNFKLLSEITFDSIRMMNSVLIEDKAGKKFLIAKGAPEIILKLSSLPSAENIKKIEEEIKEQGKQGKRVLALGFKELNKIEYTEDDENNLSFLGYITYSDPLKKTSKEAIRLAKILGVRIKVISGDAPEVAGHVAQKLDLISDPEQVILGETLEFLPELEFEKACEEFSVFARVSPMTKYKIVKKLQEKYEVGFLGEGINDTPALKVANFSIVVDSAADISKEVSDVILLKKDLKVIVDGIESGRNIFSNINKYIKCTVSSNFGNFYSIAAISLFIPYLPMLPIQILLVNLLSDFPLIAIASDRVDPEELKKPKMYQLKNFVPLITSLALVSTVFDFIFFGIFHKVDPSLLRTLWFIESILTEIMLIFSVRSAHFFAKARKPSWGLVLVSFMAIFITIGLPFTLIGQEFFSFVMPPLYSLMIVLGLIFCYLILSEIAKLIFFKRFWHNHEFKK